MKNSFALIMLVATMNGCALVYTGSVKTGDNQKAIGISKILEAEYVRQGFQKDDVPPQAEAYYWASWVTPSAESTNYNAIWIGDWVKDGTLFIRIVPQPGCNDASRKFGEHMKIFITNSFPDLEWNLVGRFEPDLFR
jgi:hypothetical protein